MESIYISAMPESKANEWDDYVHTHDRGTVYHLSGWKKVIRKTYGHKDYYLMALKHPVKNSEEISTGDITGVLPLVHIDNLIFGSSLISVPFLDYGGILADNAESEDALLRAALNLAQKIGAEQVELRNIENSGAHGLWENRLAEIMAPSGNKQWHYQVRSHKVRMLFELPDSSAKLMSSFKSKLRSQIRKPMKIGLETKIGGLELLDDFYTVFSRNMKELGSPVHSKGIVKNVLGEFNEKSRIVIVYKGKRPLAGSVVIGYRDILENPWASSLREFSKISPNMLLYWAMLVYGCDQKYKQFDFGRSSMGEGTYKFKEQWGARPVALHWCYISKRNKNPGHPVSEDARFQRASEIWKKLPEHLTNLLGPVIRKYIGL
jgi:FemAB-related protein (PEP-CTERM system-associated)